MMAGLQPPAFVCRHVSDTVHCLLQSSAVSRLSIAFKPRILGSVTSSVRKAPPLLFASACGAQESQGLSKCRGQPSTDLGARQEGLDGLLQALQLLGKVHRGVDVQHVPEAGAHHHHIW